MKGQSMVELAVSILILLLLLSGAVEFGIAFFQFVQLRDAAQEGAQYGSYCKCDASEIQSRIRASSGSPIDLTDPKTVITVTVKDPTGNAKALPSRCEGDGLEVRLTFEHKIFMPFLAPLLGRDTIPLNAVVVNTVLVPVC